MNYRSRILNRIQINLRREEASPMALSTVLLVFLILMTLLFLTPSLAIISSVKEKNTKLKLTQNELEQKYKNYTLAASYYDSIKVQIPTLLKNIPADSDPYYFVRQANRYSIENGGVLKAIRLIEKDNGAEGYTLNLSGNYTSIENFFKSLKSDDRYFSTELITLTLQDTFTSSQNNKLNLNAKIYVFYQN